MRHEHLELWKDETAKRLSRFRAGKVLVSPAGNVERDISGEDSWVVPDRILDDEFIREH